MSRWITDRQIKDIKQRREGREGNDVVEKVGRMVFDYCMVEKFQCGRRLQSSWKISECDARELHLVPGFGCAVLRCAVLGYPGLSMHCFRTRKVSSNITPDCRV